MRLVRNKWVMLTVSAVALPLFITQVLLLTNKPVLGVESKVTIRASAQEVFDVMNHLPDCHLWLPWDQRGPVGTRTYSTPASGEGAHCTWEEPVSGKLQSLLIRQSFVDSGSGRIDITLQCEHNNIHWGPMWIHLKESTPGRTEVYVKMIGKRGFKAQLAANFVDQKAEVVYLLEVGLNNLKQHLEQDNTPVQTDD